MYRGSQPFSRISTELATADRLAETLERVLRAELGLAPMVLATE